MDVVEGEGVKMYLLYIARRLHGADPGFTMRHALYSFRLLINSYIHVNQPPSGGFLFIRLLATDGKKPVRDYV